MRARTMRKLAAPALLLGATLGLQGCVAGVIPLAAASGLIGKRTILGDDEGADAASADTGANAGAIAGGATDPARAPLANAAAGSDLVPPEAGAGDPVAFDPGQSDAVPAEIAIATLPPEKSGPLSAELDRPGALATSAEVSLPEPAIPVVVSGRSEAEAEAETGAVIAINQLLSFANQRRATAGKQATSAMLIDRISLKPERARCSANAPIVLLDLDPAGGVFDPASAAQPLSGLGGGLARLRAEGVKIAWISANPARKASDIRTALTRSGLDIKEEDRLLLLRKPDDRKQKLREDLAKEACLIAIAGDTRSDFDELYDYLLNPADAGSLEPLIGDGWFLIPQPLLSERPNP